MSRHRKFLGMHLNRRKWKKRRCDRRVTTAELKLSLLRWIAFIVNPSACLYVTALSNSSFAKWWRQRLRQLKLKTEIGNLKYKNRKSQVRYSRVQCCFAALDHSYKNRD